jgi:hypothetical protein
MLANAFNKINYKDLDVWKKLEDKIIKYLHKLKPYMFAEILTLFNKKIDKDYSKFERRSIFYEMDDLTSSSNNNSSNQSSNSTSTELSVIPSSNSNNKYRGSWEFFNKLITVLPVQIEKMTTLDVVRVMEVMILQNIKPTKLLRYFIYPKFEKTAKKLNFQVYIRMLKVLAEMQFQEDKVFWKDYVLENIYNLDMSENEVNLLYHVLRSVKISCPDIDFTKFLVILEKLSETFMNIKTKEANIEENDEIKTASSRREKPKKSFNKSKSLQEKRMRVERDFSISQVDYKSTSNVSNKKLKNLMKLDFNDINLETKEGKMINELKQNISEKLKEYEEVKLKNEAAKESENKKNKERPKAKKTPKASTGAKTKSKETAAENGSVGSEEVSSPEINSNEIKSNKKI